MIDDVQKQYNEQLNNKIQENKMDEKQETEKEVIKQESTDKSITDLRVEYANACIALLEDKGIAKKDMTKILSRAYNIIKK